MNKRARLNYIHAMSTQVEHKKMYKAKKQWVVAGLSFLVATGLGIVGGQLTTHADTTNVSQQTTTLAAPKLASGSSNNVSQKASTNTSSVKPSVATSSSIKPSASSNGIQHQAEALHGQVVANGMNALNKIKNTPVNSSESSDASKVSNSANGKQSVSKNSSTSAKSNVSASASDNVKHGFGAMQLNAQAPKVSQQATDTNWIWTGNGFTSDNQITDWKTNAQLGRKNYYNMTYKYSPSTKALIFTSGQLNGNWVANFLRNDNGIKQNQIDSDVQTAKSIKFDNHFTLDTLDKWTSNMFSDISNLVSLNLNNAELGNGSDMQNMFASDANLRAVNLGNYFDTKNITNMGKMFGYDSKLQYINLGQHFNTSKVKDMSFMFAYVPAQSLDLGNQFDTSNVINMRSMFADMYNIQSLNLGNKFNTSNVQNMMMMFIGDTSLTSLNFGNQFNTSKVNTMLGMFSDLHSMKTLSLPNTFNTQSVKDMAHIFDSDYSMENLTLPNSFTTKNTPSLYMMFIRDGIWNPNGTNIYLSSNFDTTEAMNNNSASSYGGYNKGNSNGLTDMLQYANINSITVPQGANFKLNNQAQLKPLYQETSTKDDKGNPYTLATSHDFINNLRSKNVGVFTNQNIQASDIYSGDDDIKSPLSIKDDNVNGVHWTYVDAQGNISKTPVANTQGHVLVAPIANGLTYKYDKKNNSIEFVNGTLQWNGGSFFQWGQSPFLRNVQHVKFDSDVATNNLTNMSFMFSHNKALQSISFPKDFNVKNVNSIQSMFGNDSDLQDLDLSSLKFSSNLKNVWWVFTGNTSLKSLILPTSFPISSSMNDNHIIYDNNKLQAITIPDTNTKFNSSSLIGSWYPVASNANGLEKDGSGKYITKPVSEAVNLADGNSHVGTWVKAPNVPNVTDTIAFYNLANNDLVSKTTINGNDGDKYDLKSNSSLIPSGYQLVNAQGNQVSSDNFTINPNKFDNVEIKSNNPSTNTKANKDIPVAPTMETTTINYKNGNKTISYKNDLSGQEGQSVKSDIDNNQPQGWHLLNSNSDNQKFYSDANNKNTFNIAMTPNQVSDEIDYMNGTKPVGKFNTPKGNDYRTFNGTTTITNKDNLPAGYQLVPNQNDTVNNDGSKHPIKVQPIQQKDTIQFMNGNKQIGNNSITTGNDSRTGINGTSTVTLPKGYQLANGASASVANDGKTHQISITPIQKTDTINYQLNGTTKSRHQFTGNDSSAQGANSTSFTISSTNDPDIPQGYQLVKPSTTFNYDGGTYNVAIEATNQTATVNYQVNGKTISTGTISGDVNTSKTPAQAPQGYHFSGNVAPYSFTPANAGHNPSDDVNVAPNTVKGTATIHINYNVSGHTYNGTDQKVNINGQYGDSDQMVYPVQYQPSNDDYNTTSQPLDINFNDIAKNGSNNNYNPSATFTYNATEAPNLVIRYDDTTNNNNVVHSDTYTPSDLGIAPQDWVEGNTITLGTGNQGTSTNKGTNVINAPYGYHLEDNKNGFDYKNGQESITLEPNATVSGSPVVLMSMPMLTGNKAPNSQSNNNPAKPASNASGSASSATSISMDSNELSSLAKDIGGDINVTVRPNVTNTTTTIDDTTLNSLASEVATNNQEISSLANKPTSTANTTNNVNYSYFDNLVNNGVDKLTNAINKDFKANLHNVHAQRTHKITVKRVRKHIKWIMIMKPVKLYNKATLVGTKHGVKTLRPNHEITLNVKDVYKVHNKYVFKVNYKHHNYFITANHNYVRNSYLPLDRKVISRKVRVLNDVYGYRHKNHDVAKTYHKGFVGRIKNIVRLGHYNMTRIQLTNGLWISANKNFIKLI